MFNVLKTLRGIRTHDLLSVAGDGVLYTTPPGPFDVRTLDDEVGNEPKFLKGLVALNLRNFDSTICLRTKGLSFVRSY
jgi:hypothetical protein